MRKLKTRKKTADCISYKSGGKGAQEDHNEEWQETGEEIRHTLQNIGTRIEAPDSLKQRIDFRITEKLEKEEHKKNSFRSSGSQCLNRDDSGCWQRNNIL